VRASACMLKLERGPVHPHACSCAPCPRRCDDPAMQLCACMSRACMQAACAPPQVPASAMRPTYSDQSSVTNSDRTSRCFCISRTTSRRSCTHARSSSPLLSTRPSAPHPTLVSRRSARRRLSAATCSHHTCMMATTTVSQAEVNSTQVWVCGRCTRAAGPQRIACAAQRQRRSAAKHACTSWCA
jgi:hypothetical protein